MKIRIANLETEIKEIKKILNPDYNADKFKFDNKSVIIKENEYGLISKKIKIDLRKTLKDLKNYIKQL